MFNLKTIAIAVAISASALVSTAPAADARQKVVVIEQTHRSHKDMRRDHHSARDYRASRRAEARRAEARRHDRRHDRRKGGPVIVLKTR